MKFGFVSTMETAPWGGSEDLWAGAASLLLRQGHSVAACVKDWHDDEAATLGQLARDGAQLFRRRTPTPQRTLSLLGRKILHRLCITRPEASVMVTFLEARPDLTMVTLGGGVPSDYCFSELRQAGLPYVVAFQAASECWWPDDESRDRAVEILREARAVFFVSEGNRHLISRQLVYEHPRTFIVRNPFRVAYDQALPWPRETSPTKIAIVGRLEPDAKGCDLALEVFALPQWKNRDIVPTFFGTGHASRSVQALAARLDLTAVRFAGHIADISELWRSHHLLLLPSRYEGLPLAIIEAMLCGRPCVTTTVGGNAELVTDGETGFLADFPTVASLAQALERAWDRRDEWPAIGAAAAHAIRTVIPPSPCADVAALLTRLATPD